MELKKLGILEQGGICRMLVYLSMHPEGILRVDYRKPPLNLGYRASVRDHEKLYDAGLIEHIDSPNEFKFRLTEKGKRIAEKLKEILNELIL